MRSKYSITLSQDEWDTMEVRSAWSSMIAGNSNAKLIGQSPEFIDHLRSIQVPSRLCLALIRDSAGSICSVVPLVSARWGLRFDISGHTLAERRLSALRIQGSVPRLPPDPDLHDQLFAAFDQGFADCQVIVMPSVPTDSFLWSYIRNSQFLKGRFIPYVLHGVRPCHVIPLPETVEGYLAKFKAKKRYNLKRQVRILRQHFGGRLELRRIDSPREVRDLFKWITPPGELAGLTRWGESKSMTIDRREVESLATRGLLLMYLMIGAGRPCAAVVGMQYGGVYYVDSIPRNFSFDRFSPGSTTLHLAIEDLIRHTSIRRIDLGFGSPAYSHCSTNIVEPRASILLFRRTLGNQLLRITHGTFDSLIDVGKSFLAHSRTVMRVFHRPVSQEPVPAITIDESSG
jgi:hypothetical protein